MKMTETSKEFTTEEKLDTALAMYGEEHERVNAMILVMKSDNPGNIVELDVEGVYTAREISTMIRIVRNVELAAEMKSNSRG